MNKEKQEKNAHLITLVQPPTENYLLSRTFTDFQKDFDSKQNKIWIKYKSYSWLHLTRSVLCILILDSGKGFTI